MDAKLNTIGYDFGPSKYTPVIGYSDLKVIISGKPTQRFFDVRSLHLRTFNGHYVRQAQITRHEVEPNENFQVCLGEMKMEAHQGETMRAFSFGGNLHTSIENSDLLCVFTANAPVFKLEDEPVTPGGVIADEILDLLAEKAVNFPHHEDELYLRLAKYEPYQLFLACMVSLQNRVESIPIAQRREGYHKIASNINHAIQIVHDTDGWNGHSPSLEELLSTGGE